MQLKEIVLTGPGTAEVLDLPEPPSEIPAGHILTETVYSGVTNGTERHLLLGEHRFGARPHPHRAGYQQVGKVLAVADDVEDFAPGDWVIDGRFVGHRGWNLVPANKLLLRLPETMADKRDACLFGTASVALRGVRRFGIAAGHKVLVVGLGPIGQFHAQSAKAAGAHVTVSDIAANRLELASCCGADRCLDAGDENYFATVKAAGPYDFIIDCCNLPSFFRDIHEHGLLAFGGCIGAMAVRSDIECPWSLLHGRQARIEVSCHFDRDDLRVLLQLYQQGKIRTEPLFTHRLPLDQAPQFYAETLAQSAADLLGAMFIW